MAWPVACHAYHPTMCDYPGFLGCTVCAVCQHPARLFLGVARLACLIASVHGWHETAQKHAAALFRVSELTAHAPRLQVSTPWSLGVFTREIVKICEMKSRPGATPYADRHRPGTCRHTGGFSSFLYAYTRARGKGRFQHVLQHGRCQFGAGLARFAGLCRGEYVILRQLACMGFPLFHGVIK